MSRQLLATAVIMMCVACDHTNPVGTPPTPPVNHAPVANAGDSYTTFEGYPTTFDGSRSKDPDGDSLRFEWRFEPGAPPQYGVTTTYAFTKEGGYHPTLVVTDARGASDTAITSVFVDNAAPQITAFTVPTAPVSLDSAVHVMVTFVDPGPGDTLTAALNWGDSDTEKVVSGAVASHRYAAIGQYLVHLTVRDNQGASAEANAPTLVTIYDAVVDETNPAGYDVIDLGTLGGSGAIPRALNDAGQVVGCSQVANGTWHAFTWSNGDMRDLGSGAMTSCAWAIDKSGIIAGVVADATIDGDAVVAWTSAGARSDLGAPSCCAESVGFVAVTDAGDIVGGGTDEGHGFNSAIWQNGVKRDIPSPLPASGYAAARAVNNRSQIVGYAAVASYIGNHIQHAFIWENGTTRDLGVLADSKCPDEPVRSCSEAFAVDINNNGAIVGASQDASGAYRGVRWANGTVDVIGAWQPIAINDAGDVIGNGAAGSRPDGIRVSIMDPAPPLGSGDAYFWRAGTATKLDSFDGNATQVVAINESSTVTGWSEGRGKNPHAFVWKPGQTQLLDLGIGPQGLNQLGAVATGINTRGDVIGYTVGACKYTVGGMCWLWNGPSHAILWRRKN